MNESSSKALGRLRVLDLSRMIAGGVAATHLADFGADVVKVEQPGTGDPLRQWTSEGRPYWWQVYSRNKRFITLDLKSDRGHNILLRLLPRFDVLIESFVPGALERLGLGWDVLSAHHPGLILARVSGWGQTGPGADRPGFGTLVEAASGFAAMNGEADGPPIVPSFPLADMTAALYAANAILAAVYHRDASGGTRGQVIDVSLFESLFSLLGPLPAEFAGLGRVRTRTGSRSKNSGPRGCFKTKDEAWIAVSGSTPKMAERFLSAYDLGQLLGEARFATNEARVRHSDELDRVVANAIGARTLVDNLAVIAKHKLTAVHVQTIAEITRDPHWQARQLLIDIDTRSGPVRMHDVVARLSVTPGRVDHAGGPLGEHNASFYQQELGLTEAEVAALVRSKVI
jgi:crotonobetainyl-CoA:carnitine CoA-transferase CaiB-like acyl-CoA transferase